MEKQKLYKEIIGASNETYKMIKSLRTKKGRAQHHRYLVEGPKAVGDAVRAGAPIFCYAVAKSFLEQNSQFMDRLKTTAAEIFVMSDRLFCGLCDTQTPQGVLCVVDIEKRPSPADEAAKRRGLWVYCDGLQDPGNAGTIIRTADAALAAGVLFSKGSVDIYSPKVVRSTMGSMFHIPLIPDMETRELAGLKRLGYKLMAGTLSRAAVDYRAADFCGDVVIVVGNESGGVSDEVIRLCDCEVKIPVRGKAESLNASVAAAILIYEWARQKT